MAKTALRHHSRSSRIAHDDDDAPSPPKRRRSTRLRFVNLANANSNDSGSPQSPESASPLSSPLSTPSLYQYSRSSRSASDSLRPALADVHANTVCTARRPLAPLPSRGRNSNLLLQSKGAKPSQAMPIAVDGRRGSVVGRKRKRDASRAPVASGRKRRKENVRVTSVRRGRRRSHDMDVDESEDDEWLPSASVAGEAEDEDEDVGDPQNQGSGAMLDSSDDFLLTSALPWQLHKLKKEELIRLCLLSNVASVETADGLSLEHLTKTQLVDALVSTRDREQAAPPSSAESEASVHFSHLIHHATPGRLVKTRSRHARVKVPTPPPSNPQTSEDEDATGYVEDEQPAPEPRVLTRTRSGHNAERRATFVVAPSPQALRNGISMAGLSRSKSMNDVGTKRGRPMLRTRTDPGQKDRTRSGNRQRLSSSEGIRARLRHRPVQPTDESLVNRKRLSRKAKDRVGSLKESSDEAPLPGGPEDVEELEEHQTPRDRSRTRNGPSTHRLTRSMSARSAGSLHTPISTPIINRLRPRKQRTPEPEEADQGDDEGEDEDEEAEHSPVDDESLAASNEDEEENDEEVDDTGVEEVDEEAESEHDEAGDELKEVVEASEDEVVEVDEIGNPITGDEVDTELGDEDAEGEEVEDEEMNAGDDGVDMDIDLTGATVKSLTRLRRDDLVQLCELHELDTAGTKPQLAEALLEWRDSHQSEASTSPPASTVRSDDSSASTVRPSTPRGRSRPKPRSNRHKDTKRTPLLLRSHHIHVSQPDTPPLTHGATPIPTVDKKMADGHMEPELDLDLEELGLEEKEIHPSKLTKLEKIGSGGFKDVFVGKLKGRKVAIAEIRGQLSAMDIKELTLLRDFDHPNVVRFLGVSVPENTRETPVMIVTELCANGDLYDYIRNVTAPSPKKVFGIMLDIASGLRYLHERKPPVIHRDCKSSNILITTAVRAKIADFGLAKVKQSTRSMVRSLVGTVNWQAPELWHAHPKYDYKADVFSCAMVFWEILQWHNPNKKYPWEGMNEHAIYDVVGAKKQRPSITGLRKQWGSAVVDLLENMWAQDPQDRPTMSEVHDELQRIISDL